MAAVVIDHLRKRYGEVEALKDISFTVQSGEIFGLLGPNGAGKTTTIRCLCTLAKPDSGKIAVSGISAVDNPKAVRQRLGYVAQEVALDKILTGKELLQLQADLYHIPPAQAKPRIEQLLFRGDDDWLDCIGCGHDVFLLLTLLSIRRNCLSMCVYYLNGRKSQTI